MRTSGRASTRASVGNDRSMRRTSGGAAVRIWYRVRDLERARGFYIDTLGFVEGYTDDAGGLARDRRRTETALSEGEPLDEEGGVAVVDVEDVKAERERLA